MDNYNKIGIGYGERTDFTKVKGTKGDFAHDYERMCSMKNDLRLSKANSSRKDTTFGSHWSAY